MIQKLDSKVNKLKKGSSISSVLSHQVKESLYLLDLDRIRVNIKLNGFEVELKIIKGKHPRLFP